MRPDNAADKSDEIYSHNKPDTWVSDWCDGPKQEAICGEEISICCPAQRRHQSGKAVEAGLGIEDNQTGGTHSEVTRERQAEQAYHSSL